MARYTIAPGETADFLLPEMRDVLTLQTCRICGCDHYRGCASGCSWVSDDLCSNCVGHEDQARTVKGRAVFAGRHGRQ